MSEALYARQVAALPWRRGPSAIEYLLVTSRERQRWVIPKGWPVANLSDAEAAAREAFEEGGIEGHVVPHAIGAFRYDKRGRNGSIRPCRVSVYPMEVTGLADRWPERGERVRQWFEASVAARQVDEPELRALMIAFAAGNRLP